MAFRRIKKITTKLEKVELTSEDFKFVDIPIVATKVKLEKIAY